MSFISDAYLASQGTTGPVVYRSYLGFFAHWGRFPASASAAAIGLLEPVYLGVGLSLVPIAGIFSYRTDKSNKRAQALRESTLDAYRNRLREMESRLDSRTKTVPDDAAPGENQSLQVGVRRVRRAFRNYRNAQPSPLSAGILIQPLSSLLLSIRFILFEMPLAQYLGAAGGLVARRRETRSRTGQGDHMAGRAPRTPRVHLNRRDA